MDEGFPAAEAFQDFVLSLPAGLQWLGVMLAGAVPFVESYFGSIFAIFVGLPAPLAISAAVVGNIGCMLAVVLLADRIRRPLDGEERELSGWQLWVRARLHLSGVAVVCLVGNAALPSQVIAALLVSFGVPRGSVIRWQAFAIALYGVACGLLALVFAHLVG